MLDTYAPQASVAYGLHVIRAGYLDSPSLRLTKTQVERIWGLDALMCDALLAALVDARFLKRTKAGVYMRPDTAVPDGTGRSQQHA
jgi:hypothetical protein